MNNSILLKLIHHMEIKFLPSYLRNVSLISTNVYIKTEMKILIHDLTYRFK